MTGPRAGIPPVTEYEIEFYENGDEPVRRCSRDELSPLRPYFLALLADARKKLHVPKPIDTQHVPGPARLLTYQDAAEVLAVPLWTVKGMVRR